MRYDEEPGRGARSERTMHVQAAIVPTLASLRLDMVALESGDFPGGGGVLTHALALDLIRRADPAAATAAHDGHSTITTSGLLAEGCQPLGHVRIAPGEPVTVRVSGVGQDIPQALLAGIEASRGDLRIGRTHFVLAASQYESLACPNPATIEEIAEAATCCNGRLRMRFVSPTTFKRGPTWLALPSPDNVFGTVSGTSTKGLAGRWSDVTGSDVVNGFSGARLGASALELKSTSARVRADNPLADAFLGVCEYTATSARDRRWMWALGMLAQFTGVGWKTAMGMGQVRVEQVEAE